VVVCVYHVMCNEAVINVIAPTKRLTTSNFGGNNAEGKILKNGALNKFKVLCSVGR